MHPCAIPSAAVWTAEGAERCRKAFGVIGILRVQSRAHCAACGTLASAWRLGSDNQPPGRPSRPASIRSHVSTDTASTCCRLAATTGRAVRAHTSAPRPPTLWRVANALGSGCTPAELLGVLKAIAPQVGGPRTVAAGPELMVALGLSLPDEQ